MIRAGIVGATGYAGIELCRLLATHPQVKVTRVYSQSYAGKKLAEVYPHLAPQFDLILESFSSESLPGDLDVLFLALPHAESMAVMPKLYGRAMRIVDLSADFRLTEPDVFRKYYHTEHSCPDLIPQFVHGFPELYRTKIKGARYCANPGCYATSVILGLYPLAKEGLLTSPVIVDAKSGVSGAGRSPKISSLFCEAGANVGAYATGTHRHTAEMELELNSKVFFSPHLVPMSRGILSSMYVVNTHKLSRIDLLKLYHKYYDQEYFVQLHEQLGAVTTKNVLGSNFCLIAPEVAENGQIVVFSALDNLVKGAAGQAIQNMNIMCELPETAGLAHLPLYL